MARDKIHESVKTALIKDGWTITHDPYSIEFKKLTLFADLGAEKMFSAEREGRKLSSRSKVSVKSLKFKI